MPRFVQQMAEVLYLSLGTAAAAAAAAWLAKAESRRIPLTLDPRGGPAIEVGGE